jgi:hypothetical protein
MASRKPVRKIWKKVTGARPQEPAEVVLAACRGSSNHGLHCRSVGGGAVELAVFLQNPKDHPEEGDIPADSARVKIAYRSYHPKPFRFTRRYECKGGTIDAHDHEEEFEVAAGKTEGWPFRTEVVPDGVKVERGSGGAQVLAEVDFVGGRRLDRDGPVHFTVSFPAGRELECACCRS